MRRKLVYLACEYSKEMVDAINVYFDSGYELEDIFNADNGYYMLLVLKCNENYDHRFASKFKLSDENCNLIEENNNKWVKTTTNDVLLN